MKCALLVDEKTLSELGLTFEQVASAWETYTGDPDEFGDYLRKSLCSQNSIAG